MYSPYLQMANSIHTPEDFAYFIKENFRDRLHCYDPKKVYYYGDLILHWYGITNGRCLILMAQSSGITGVYNPSQWTVVSNSQLLRLLNHYVLGQPDDPSLYNNEILGHLGPSGSTQ